MKRTVAALLASGFLLGSALAQAESLRDIYELALENDAQLKAEQAQYLARKETENLSRSALLPQVGTSYTYTDSDSDRERTEPRLQYAGPANSEHTVQYRHHH